MMMLHVTDLRKSELAHMIGFVADLLMCAVFL